jgi:hypothetical protein
MPRNWSGSCRLTGSAAAWRGSAAGSVDRAGLAPIVMVIVVPAAASAGTYVANAPAEQATQDQDWNSQFAHRAVSFHFPEHSRRRMG